jgi:hypothetical protein
MTKWCLLIPTSDMCQNHSIICSDSPILYPSESCQHLKSVCTCNSGMLSGERGQVTVQLHEDTGFCSLQNRLGTG